MKKVLIISRTILPLQLPRSLRATELAKELANFAKNMATIRAKTTERNPLEKLSRFKNGRRIKTNRADTEMAQYAIKMIDLIL